MLTLSPKKHDERYDGLTFCARHLSRNSAEKTGLMGQCKET